MNKKLLAIVIAIVTLMSFSVVGIYAITQEESNPTFYLESVKAKKDNNVSIKVFIKNNPGLWGINVKINYDKTALTLIDVENGDFFKESEWTKGDLEILSYEANGLEDITTVNGTLAILNFKVNNDAVPGKYDVSISYNAGDCINVSFEDVNFDVINGIIEVEQETLPTIEPTVSEPVTTEPITVEPTEEPTTEPITVEPTEEPTNSRAYRRTNNRTYNSRAYRRTNNRTSNSKAYGRINNSICNSRVYDRTNNKSSINK